MPNKEATELQFLSLFDSTGEDVELTFAYPGTHHFKGTSFAAIANHYVSFSEIANRYFDGLVITGAPVEKLDYRDVDYWQEFKTILCWANTHVSETILECWAALGGLFADYQIAKKQLHEKIAGIFGADEVSVSSRLTANLSQPFKIPQSRWSTLQLNQPLPVGLDVLVTNYVIGPLLLRSAGLHRTYITGHPEYTRNTLANEFHRDRSRGIAVPVPHHYFVDKTHNTIRCDWSDTSHELYHNWLNILTAQKERIY